MGFFGVLKEAGQPGCAVEKLDINVWCLPGVLTRTTIVCDIGLRLRPEHALEQLGIGIPFGTTIAGLQDLAPVLEKDAATTGLVFGGPYEPHKRDGHCIIESGSDVMELGYVDVEKTTREAGRCDDKFSHWRLVFTRPLSPSVDSYVRVRFTVDSLGRAWTWRRSLLVRRLATVDLRVCDLREALDVPNGADYEERLMPIKQLNCFVITPGSFRTARFSPDTRYVRLLEGRRWERYLGRATDLLRGGKLVITYWRPQYTVSAEKEFRAFLDLRREGWTERLMTFVLTLVAVMAGVALVSNPADLNESAVVRIASAVWDVHGVKLSLGVATILAIVTGIARAIASGRKRWQKTRRWLRSAEQHLYRLPAKLD